MKGVTQRKTNTVWSHLHTESKNQPAHPLRLKAERALPEARGWGGGRGWNGWRGPKVQACGYEIRKSRGCDIGLGTAVHNIDLQRPKLLKRINLKSFPHKKTTPRVWWWVRTSSCGGHSLVTADPGSPREAGTSIWSDVSFLSTEARVSRMSTLSTKRDDMGAPCFYGPSSGWKSVTL